MRAERRQLAAYARHGVDPLADADAAVAFAMADSRADSAAVSAKLAQILAAMADRDRDVLLLFAWADMSYAEIGQALEIPVGTVRSRLHRARRQLRALVSATSLNAESLTAESRTAESRTAESRTTESLNYTETKAWTN